jgi:hypothetical protein
LGSSQYWMRCSRRHTGVRARRLPPALADRTQLPMSKSDLLARRSTTTTRLDRSPPHHRVRRPRGQRLAGTPDRLVDQEARPASAATASIAIRTGEHILHAWRPLAGDRAGLHHCIRDSDGCAKVRGDFSPRAPPGSRIDPEEWTPRELRHPFVSVLSDAGVPLEEISRLVGHSGTTVTELVYRHQLKLVLQTGATVMDQLFKPRTDRA